MWEDFKKFALKGNVMDLAIGVIIGGAFSKIITSLVNDIIMPIISLITGRIDFNNLFISLDGKYYATIDQAKKAGAATINYGTFITDIIDFFIVAFTIFFIIKQLSKFRKEKPETAPVIKQCPYCKTDIAVDATRCPNCTSQL